MALAKPPKAGEAGAKFKINPEVNTRLEKFMKDEPGLVDYVKELPRDQLERKFLLSKMRAQEQQQGYTAKVRAWLEKPEQADLRKSLTASVAPNMKPEKQDQAVTNMARTTSAPIRSSSADERDLRKKSGRDVYPGRFRSDSIQTESGKESINRVNQRDFTSFIWW